MAGGILAKYRSHPTNFGNEFPYVNRDLSLDLDGAPNTLAISQVLGPEGLLVAVGGRKIFKIVRLSQGKLESKMSLRDLPPRKTVNLNFSTLHIQWKPGSDRHLATAPPNGCIVLWDLEKSSKNKQEYIFEKNHERAVNKLCFHPRDGNLLLSGSQDATVKLFDLRTKGEALSLNGPDSVKDVKFCPFPSRENVIMAAFENGMVQLWDKRKTDYPTHRLTAHSGPVYNCEWHLERENCFATGGRDKNLKVFELQHDQIKETHSISTILPISRVNWRPSYKSQLGSCFQILDSTVFVWEYFHPYVPLLAFGGHKDDVTDFLWLNDREVLSCSKDGRILVQTLKSADKPTDKMSPVALAFGREDSISFGCRIQLNQRPRTQNSRYPMSFKREPDSSQPLEASNCLLEYNTAHKATTSGFIQCAHQYRLHCSSIEDMCHHNAQVCDSLDMKYKAKTWEILALMYATAVPVVPHRGSAQAAALGELLVPGAVVGQSRRSSTHSAQDQLSSAPTPQPPASDQVGTEAVKPSEQTIMASQGEDDTMSLDSFKQDMFFNENEDDELSDIAIATALQNNTQEWELLSADAVISQLQPPAPSAERPRSPGGRSTFSGVQSESTTAAGPAVTITVKDAPRPSVDLPRWDQKPLVVETLRFYARQGDVQMAVSMLLVLGEQGKSLVCTEVQSPPNSAKLTAGEVVQYLTMYFDQLACHQLWSVLTLVKNLCTVVDLRERELLPSILPFNISCGSCKQVLPWSKKQCQKCLAKCTICSVCHQPVKGLVLYCYKCGHGGHVEHLVKWLTQSKQCPAGCGCICRVA